MKAFRFEIKSVRTEYLSFAASFLLHLGIFVSIVILLNISDDRARVNPPYVQVTTETLNSKSNNASQNRESTGEEKKSEKQSNANEKWKKYKAAERSNEPKTKAAFYNFSNIKADTTGLDQIYRESTLNVTIKYPAGWTYVDQDIKHRLDGVTFWSNLGNYSPPPYIHLEVKDKDLFSRSRYKYNLKMRDFVLYYNDPEKLEGQITQTFYVRTNSDEDFSLELIMEGDEAFKSFQPVFLGMIKTFKFGRNWF